MLPCELPPGMKRRSLLSLMLLPKSLVERMIDQNQTAGDRKLAVR